MKKYLPRYTDYELKESLEYMGAVLITGPKWCGKTTTAKQQCNSLKELQHPVYGKSYLKQSIVLMVFSCFLLIVAALIEGHVTEHVGMWVDSFF